MPTPDYTPLVIAFAVGAVLSALLAWALALRRSAVREAQLASDARAAQERNALLEPQLEQARERLDAAQAAAQALSRTNAALEGNLRHLGDRYDEKLRELAVALEQLEAARDRELVIEQRVARLAAEEEAHRRSFEQVQEFIANAREQLSARFGEIAGDLFDRKSQLFAAQSSQGLDALLKPFAEELKGFRAKVETLYGDEAKERASVRGAVEQLTSLNSQMSAQAQALTNALRGNVKHRGNWGEMILDTVLQASGLEEGTHYTRQGGERDEEGRLRLPDVVVRLPDERSVVIDSKLSLAAWQDAVNADNDESRDAALKLHTTALGRHVRELGRKDYSSLFGSGALDLVLLFVPIEGALAAALAENPRLTTDALDCKVALVAPNTLVAVLRTIGYVWAREQRRRNHEEIARRAKSMLEALGRFKLEFDKLGRKVAEASKAFEDASSAFASNRGPMNQARLLEKLGVKATLKIAEAPGQPYAPDAEKKSDAPDDEPQARLGLLGGD